MPGNGIRRLAWESKDACQTKSLSSSDAGLNRSTVRTDVGLINTASMRRAHALVESGEAFGNVVLSESPHKHKQN